jgi:hypothetical protein
LRSLGGLTTVRQTAFGSSLWPTASSTPAAPLVGHDAIRNWGRARIASNVRTRHICSGMRFIDRGNGRATGSTLLTVFMHDGKGRGPAVPAIVGEDTDEFVRTKAGWRFASRTFETLFA